MVCGWQYGGDVENSWEMNLPHVHTHLEMCDRLILGNIPWHQLTAKAEHWFHRMRPRQVCVSHFSPTWFHVAM